MYFLRKKLLDSLRRQASARSLLSQGRGERKSATVDEDEVNRFSENFGSSDVWWRSDTLAPLRALNELRVPLIRDNLLQGKPIGSSRPLSGFKLLEVGSGGGLLCEPLARLGAQMTGIDPVQGNVRIASEHLEEQSPELKSNLSYVQSPIEDFASKENNGSFDGLIASEVLEHVDDVDLFLRSSHQLLKPGGQLFVTTINQTAASYLLGILVAERVLGLLPQGTHSYDKLVPVNGLQLMLQEIGYSVQLIHGMMFNPLSGRWSWIRNTNINYALIAVKEKDVPKGS